MIEQIEADLKAALKAGQKDKVLVLKGLKSAMINERIKLGHELSAEESLIVVKREAKQRDEAAELYEQGGAQDKAAKELSEKTVLEQYLPEMMSAEEIGRIADEVIANTGSDASKMGVIIGQVMSRTKGMADGRQVADIVKSKL